MCRGLPLEQLAIGEAGHPPLAHRLRHPALADEPGQVVGAVGLDDVFHPDDIIGFEGPRDPQGAVQVPARVALDRDLHAVAHRRADLLDEPQAGLQVLGR